MASYTGTPGTRTERTFLAIKPDGVQRGLIGEIIKRFETKGFKLVALKLTVPTQAQAEAHYEEHAGKKFFPSLVSFFTAGTPLVLMVWEGADSILSCRKLIGSTKPTEASVGSIRGDYAVDMGRNLIHGSDGVASAAREIALWFQAAEVVDWSSAVAASLYE